LLYTYIHASRARNQFQMVRSIGEQAAEYEAIVAKYV
jgi:hypothetical protein